MGSGGSKYREDLLVVRVDKQARLKKNSFSRCKRLQYIHLHVPSVPTACLRDCVNLVSVCLPPGVTSIGEAAFHGCKRLRRIIIPSSVTFIGEAAFSGCQNLRDVEVGSAGMKRRESFEITRQSDERRGRGRHPQRRRGNYGAWEIVSGPILMKLESGIWHGCTSLRSVSLPPHTQEIPDFTFNKCLQLVSIDLPPNMISIGTSAFEMCTSLSDLVLPSTLKNIGDRAFYQCSSITHFNLPDGVNRIPSRAFENCYRLQSVIISSNVTSMGEYAFRYCHKLRIIEVLVPDIVSSKVLANDMESRLPNNFRKETTLLTSTNNQDAEDQFELCSSLREVVIKQRSDDEVVKVTVNETSFPHIKRAWSLWSESVPASVKVELLIPFCLQSSCVLMNKVPDSFQEILDDWQQLMEEDPTSYLHEP